MTQVRVRRPKPVRKPTADADTRTPSGKKLPY